MRGTQLAIARFLMGVIVLAGSAPLARAQVSDVPYVPTPPNVVDVMLGIAKVGPDDYVIDLGSGDGRIVIAAARKYGARGFGVDIDDALVDEARRQARRQGVSDRVTFATRNLFITDISDATVITMYLFPQVNMQLRPRFLKELKPGTRIVSHEFDLDEWQPDAKVVVPVPDKPYGDPSSNVFLWVVPADASGSWRWRLAGGDGPPDCEVTLEQTYQMLTGEGQWAGRSARVSGRVRGEEVSLRFVSEADGRPLHHELNGRLSGDAIRGTAMVRGGMQREWQATRTARGNMKVNSGAAFARHTTIAEELR
ncbi:MAG TPA: class I SAM-dependent methyltransferase [Burkholderiales bacterium]|nr:class I SAM-dependent methyltransferase [Burkholderiales bacterium]